MTCYNVSDKPSANRVKQNRMQNCIRGTIPDLKKKKKKSTPDARKAKHTKILMLVVLGRLIMAEFFSLSWVIFAIV